VLGRPAVLLDSSASMLDPSAATPAKASMTALTASPNPSETGAPVTLTATVRGKSSGRVPTGTVTFSDDGTPFYAQVLVKGTATVMTGQGGVPALAAGSHVITAAYHGDQYFTGSTSNTVTQVVKMATSTAVASSANPSVQGQAVTYTAMVSSGDGGGSVSFAASGTPITGCKALSLNSSGQATCRVTYATTGRHYITAAYSGDAAGGPSTSAVLTQHVVVDRADLEVRLSMPTTAVPGAIVTQKVTVTNLGPATARTEVTALNEPSQLAVISAGGALVRGPLLTWSRPSLAPGASRTFTVMVQVTSHASGTLTVAAGALSITQDPDMLNNVAFGEITIG
jgi:large repetitive protein